MAAPRSAPPPPAILAVHGVEKRYGEARVLKGVSLQVTPGRVLGLLGPNGAGKTSLIRMVLDLTRPDGGSLEVLGQPPSSGLKDRIGYLPEERGLYPKQRVIDVLTYLVGLSGLSRDEARRRAQGWLERVGLAEEARKKVRTLSKGMQQKVQVGAAILHDPELVILDEPFTGLDPMNRRLIGEVVRELVAKGAGVIVSTHQLDQAQQLCDDVVLIRRGQVILSGTVAEVRERFAGRGVELGTEAPWAPEGEVSGHGRRRGPPPRRHPGRHPRGRGRPFGVPRRGPRFRRPGPPLQPRPALPGGGVHRRGHRRQRPRRRAPPGRAPGRAARWRPPG